MPAPLGYCRRNGRFCHRIQRATACETSCKTITDATFRSHLLDVDVGQAAAIEPSTEAVFGGGTLGAAFMLGERHSGARFLARERDLACGFGIGSAGVPRRSRSNAVAMNLQANADSFECLRKPCSKASAISARLTG